MVQNGAPPDGLEVVVNTTFTRSMSDAVSIGKLEFR